MAAFAIEEMEKGNLYSIPQMEYRLAWLLKRLMPNTFYRVIGWLYRHQRGPYAP